MTADPREPLVGGLPPGRSGLGWQAASQPSSQGVHSLNGTENLDFVLSQFTAAECNDATDGLARDLDVGMTTTSELMADFLNDLNNERLT